MKNILFLWDRLNSLGGVETFLISLSKNLNREKYNIYLGVFENGYVAKYFEEIGVNVLKIERKNKFDFKTLIELSKIIDNYHIDIIHTHGHFGGISGRIIGKLKKKKVISTYHSPLNYDPHPDLTKKLTKLTLPLADYITFVSKSVSDTFNLKSKKQLVIYNGIDLEEIRKNAGNTEKTRKELKIKESDVFLLNIGRLTNSKGQEYLIKSIKILIKDFPNVKLKIFGEGELREKYENLIKELNLESYIEILKPRKDIYKAINACDIFVFPSLYEGFSMVLLEVGAIGKPVVAADVPGVNEIIKDEETGILVESENEYALAKGIKKIIKNKNLQRLLANNLNQLVERKFNIDNMIKNYEKLYENQKEEV